MLHHPFAHPWLLLALAALPLVALLAVRAARRRRHALEQYAGPVRAALYSTGSRLRAWLIGIGLVALILGLAGPQWGRDWSQSAAPGRDLIIVLDCSRSMFAEQPARLERGRAAILDLIAQFHKRGGHRLSLIVFAGKARLVCPLTHDLDHLREAVELLDTDNPDPTLGQGTRIGAALELAVETAEGRSKGSCDILLLSDGDDPARDLEWLRGVEKVQSEGIPVHCVGLGDPVEGARIPAGKGWLMLEGKVVRTTLQAGTLRTIASRTAGQLWLPGSRGIDLGEHYLNLARQRGSEESPDVLPVYRQRYRWFLVPAFVFLLLSLIIPERRPAGEDA